MRQEVKKRAEAKEILLVGSIDEGRIALIGASSPAARMEVEITKHRIDRRGRRCNALVQFNRSSEREVLHPSDQLTTALDHPMRSIGGVY